MTTFGAESTTDDVLGDRDLTGVNVVITGTSAGLGVETARSLVTRGATVVGVVRDEAKARTALDAAGAEGVDLYEADRASLDAATANMAALAPDRTSESHWIDLASEPVARRYDAIVMNPPFHTGRAAEPALGEAMLRAAAAALRPGGRLFLVANRGLPYEAVLRGSFSSMGEMVRGSTFKVLWASR